MTIIDKYNNWLINATEDETLVTELAGIKKNTAAIEDRFYRELEFGTGGLRGVLGAGTNRMNIYTVAKATQGYCNYLIQKNKKASVSIAYDSRIKSDVFARTAAEVFAANGITAFIFPRLMPTPALSFAVRDLKCNGGIVITASHNPAKYNGYKVYDSNGCQITTEAAEAIQGYIHHLDPFSDVKRLSFNDGLLDQSIRYIKEDTIERYLHAVFGTSVLPKDISRDLRIVYTPLNGAGISCVTRCLQEQGFNNIILPDEQKEPNGEFPTCPYPNPEEREALSVGLDWARRTGSDLVLATDPDCDRVGCAVKNGDGYTLISGNEMGVLLFDFICIMRLANGTMPRQPVAVKTIVTTPMAVSIAAKYGVELIDVLTGFKFIGEQIGMMEKHGQLDRYIFGFEESYGYLSGTFVRDKDAVNAALLICELFAFHRARGKTLIQALEELNEEHGYYADKLLSFSFEGAVGFAVMQAMMDSQRKGTAPMPDGMSLKQKSDYLTSVTTNADCIAIPITLPKSDVISYSFSNGTSVVLRPSGTEPKLKVYLSCKGKTKAACEQKLSNMEAFYSAWVNTYRKQS